MFSISLAARTSSDGDADLALVRAARADPHAFAAIYDRHADTVYRYLYRQTNSHEAAEDLTSVTFMRALASLSLFREKGTFLPWLMRIAHNALIDQLRRGRRTTTLEAGRLEQLADRAAGTTAWQVPFGGVEQRESFLAHTARLPRDLRHALALRFVADLSTEDTAAVLGRSVGATKMLVARAVATLRTRATGQGEGIER